MGYASFLMSLYIAIFLITWLVFVYAFPLRKLMATRILMMLTFAFCVISFCTLNVYVSQDYELKVLFSRLRFLGLAFLGPCWLLFVSSVFDRWTWLQKKKVLFLIFSPTIVTITLTLFPQTRDLVVTDFQPYISHGVSVVTFRGGTWFPYHILSGYLYVLMACALGLWIVAKGNPQERRQALVLLAGSVLSSAIDIYCVVTSSPYRWLMASGGTFILNEAAIAYAMFKHRLLDITPLAIEKIFQDIPDPILVVDNNGFLRTANHSAKKTFRLRRSSMGKELNELIPEMKSEIQELCLSIENESRFFSVQSEALRSEDGLSAGAIVSFREITSQKRAEKRLNENLDFKARLLEMIAHDLSGNMKNQALLSSLLQNQVSPEYKEHMNMLQSSTSASSDLMSNILAWAKSQEDQFIPQIRRFEIKILIRECLELLEPTLEFNGIRVHFETCNHPVIVSGDSEMIASVVRNLLSNSIRASRKGQAIYVHIETDDKSVTVKIRDEGFGMSREKCEALMKQSFQLLSEQKESREGYGIGLKIVRRFIELHQGEFFIESIVGVGTTVCFRIPI